MGKKVPRIADGQRNKSWKSSKNIWMNTFRYPNRKGNIMLEMAPFVHGSRRSTWKMERKL